MGKLFDCGGGAMPGTSIVLFRQDLRLEDNPALTAAIARGRPILPVFIASLQYEGEWQPGAASRWWLHRSLAQLDLSLRPLGSRLILRQGSLLNSLQKLVLETDATAVFWNRRYEPDLFSEEMKLKTTLVHAGLEAESCNGYLLYEPAAIRTGEGTPFKIFTAFWNACLARGIQPPPPLKPPVKRLLSPVSWPGSLPLEALRFEPKPDWAAGLRQAWSPGEDGAVQRLNVFLEQGLLGYAEARNLPGQAGTSRLSPHLHFGEISPRTIYHAVMAHMSAKPESDSRRAMEAFLRQLGWREFAWHLLWHFPATSAEPLRSEFARFPWRASKQELAAWQRGRTGYPLVDAGMRELWTTGWMHNRVRMVVASFLTKDLLLPWQEGARWFWDTLVDADLANNTFGWQWVAGCGADAAPYFRIFNPVTQSEKFNPSGDYIRRWIPELARLPNPWIHCPWKAPAVVLKNAGVNLRKDYPLPIVDHLRARERALAAHARIR
jgi:deoxyribodipyrimidine photo-lyase